MYTKFYGLTQSPFGISPNPQFYFPTPRHDEAWANLWCGIQQRKGCVVLTGEVGTGKTLLVRRVMNELDGTKIRYAYIFNPKMSPDDFFSYVLTDLGLTVKSQTRGQMLAQLNKLLLNVCNQHSTVALIVDEAHLLSREMLEEIRLLTNLENTQHKLLQILLVGQSELDTQLELPELRQLKQRIALRCRLEPLSPEETVNYISSRIKLAQAPDFGNRIIFSHAALEQIKRYSRGIPRIINTICENALTTGYAKEMPMVGAEIIEQVAKDFHLQPEDEPQPASARAAAAGNKEGTTKDVSSTVSAVFREQDTRDGGGQKVQ